MLSGEATTTNSIVFGLTRPGLEPTTTTLEASTLTLTPPMRSCMEGEKQYFSYIMTTIHELTGENLSLGWPCLETLTLEMGKGN